MRNKFRKFFLLLINLLLIAGCGLFLLFEVFVYYPVKYYGSVLFSPFCFYAIMLYRAFRSEMLRKKDRATAIQKIALYLKRTERMVYNYLKEVLDEEDKQLKQRAYELLKQGKTQEEIAQELGVDQSTVSRYLSSITENASQMQKSLKICIFEMISKMHNLSPSHSTFMTLNLNKDFVELLFMKSLKLKGYHIITKLS